jgi:hypothetical protein
VKTPWDQHRVRDAVVLAVVLVILVVLAVTVAGAGVEVIQALGLSTLAVFAAGYLPGAYAKRSGK